MNTNISSENPEILPETHSLHQYTHSYKLCTCMHTTSAEIYTLSSSHVSTCTQQGKNPSNNIYRPKLLKTRPIPSHLPTSKPAEHRPCPKPQLSRITFHEIPLLPTTRNVPYLTQNLRAMTYNIALFCSKGYSILEDNRTSRPLLCLRLPFRLHNNKLTLSLPVNK